MITPSTNPLFYLYLTSTNFCAKFPTTRKGADYGRGVLRQDLQGEVADQFSRELTVNLALEPEGGWLGLLNSLENWKEIIRRNDSEVAFLMEKG